MSGYAEMQRDSDRATWVAKWVPDDDPILADPILADPSPEMFRFTLARARAAEAELETYRRGIRDFWDLIRRAGGHF